MDETVKKLKGMLQAQGVTLFALVDHSGEAAKVGMPMRPTKLLIFGSPKAGTPVMLAAPRSGIDLQQHLDNLRRKDSLRGAETAEISVRLRNYSASHFEGSALPLKMLIWEDAQGKVWVTYNSPVYVQERHSLPPELLHNIGVVETWATKAAA